MEAKRILDNNNPDQDYESKLENLRLIAIREPQKALDLLEEYIKEKEAIKRQKEADKECMKEALEELSDYIPTSQRSEIE